LKPTLFTSERLFFREFSIEDAAFYYELNLDWEVMKHTGDVHFESIEASKEFLESYDPYSKTGFGRWTVGLKKTNELIGWCGLKLLEDRTVDLGYRLAQKHWGFGYATEASLKSIEIGFKEYDLEEIIGRTAKDNMRSLNVLYKTGMKFWKKDTCEGIEDSVFYKISKEDYGKI
jgi:ribosomal-protein-alanine N-acetyltransferase